MKEQFEGALTLILQKTVGGIDQTVGFLKEELPDVIQQLMAWYFTYNLILFLIFIVLSVGSTTAAVIVIRRVIAGRYTALQKERGFNIFMIIAVTGFVNLIASLALLNVQWLKIWIAPKIWLIEYAAELAGK